MSSLISMLTTPQSLPTNWQNVTLLELAFYIDRPRTFLIPPHPPTTLHCDPYYVKRMRTSHNLQGKKERSFFLPSSLLTSSSSPPHRAASFFFLLSFSGSV